ncbi:MAG: hypothetical protein IPJ24_15915 [bacterium]|nr:hypothetical protein [bacterium]
MLTGRMAAFDTLNTWGGMSRFIEPKESVHDVLGASHAGTAISTAAGLAMARRADGSGRCVVAVVGDGALVEGASFEGPQLRGREFAAAGHRRQRQRHGHRAERRGASATCSRATTGPPRRAASSAAWATATCLSPTGTTCLR